MFDFVAKSKYRAGRHVWLVVSVTMLLPIAACNRQGTTTQPGRTQNFCFARGRRQGPGKCRAIGKQRTTPADLRSRIIEHYFK